MRVIVGVSVVVARSVRVPRLVTVMAMVGWLVVMLAFEMHLEFHPGNAGFVPAQDMEVIPFELELLQFLFQWACLDPEVNERADKHIAADATAQIEVERFHDGSASALI
jgi:hypothetical protein